MNSLLAQWEARQSRSEHRRWLASTALVAGACGVALSLWHWHRPIAAPSVPPAAAMVIELTPPRAPPQPSAQPVGERKTEAPRPQPPRPRPPPKIETPAPSEIALPDRQTSEPAPEPEPAAALQTQAPASHDAPAAAVATAPRQSAAASGNAAEQASFEQLLLAHLERNKRYPRNAQMRRQQGVCHLRFVMNRVGAVLSSRLERGSGHALLDEEAQALLQRAQPLPEMPRTIEGDTLEVVVPVAFFMPRS